MLRTGAGAGPPTAGRPREDIPALHLIAPPGHRTYQPGPTIGAHQPKGNGSSGNDPVPDIRRSLLCAQHGTHGPAYRATAPWHATMRTSARRLPDTQNRQICLKDSHAVRSACAALNRRSEIVRTNNEIAFVALRDCKER